MPVLFLGHGAPNILLESDPLLDKWRLLGEQLPRPKTILVVSAHWETQGFVLGGNRLQQTIHDFYGFPEALYEYQYPALDTVNMADELADRLGIATDHERGLDHAAWVPLIAMYPDMEIPVMQLSVSPAAGFAAHNTLGTQLSFLRRQSVLILASGVIVHNLSRLNWASYRGQPEAWARQFMVAVQGCLEKQEWDRLLDPHALSFGREAVPTMEHYLPLLVACGASQGNTPQLICDAWRYANLSMQSYLFLQSSRD
jgi:4,5-DOPA dioxygenase extradiol